MLTFKSLTWLTVNQIVLLRNIMAQNSTTEGSLLNISCTRKARIYDNYSKIYILKVMVFMRVIISVIKSPAV